MAENILKVGNIITTVSSLVQSSSLAAKSVKREESEHQREMDQVRQMHVNELLLLKKTHLLKQFTEVERHFQQLNSDLLSTNRECERDMYDQRNQYCQSSIIASSIMLSALVSVLVQGILPISQNSYMTGIYVIYAISMTLSLAFLFVCLIIYLIVIKKCSVNMSKKSIAYNKLVRRALPPPGPDGASILPVTGGSSASASLPVTGGRSVSASLPVTGGSSASALLPSSSISTDEELDHEKEITNKLGDRNKINEEIQNLLLDDNKAFDKFWTVECQYLEKVGLFCFYLGTLLFLIATAIFMYVIFQKTYFNQLGVILSLVPIGLSVCTGGYFIYYFNYILEKKWSESSQGEGGARV